MDSGFRRNDEREKEFAFSVIPVEAGIQAFKIANRSNAI